MEDHRDADRSTRQDVVTVWPKDSHLIGAAIALGDQSSRTLGFMPHAAYKQAAENGTLLAVVVDEVVAAYALHSLPRHVIKLTHLCVSNEFRGEGFARLLVETISDRHGGRSGIILYCRSDYAENKMWPHLGFVKRGTKPGRGRDRMELTVWWLDHGHPDLFTGADSYEPLKVMVDLNVFADLESSYVRADYQESRLLTDISLTDQIELVASSELQREIRRLSEDEREHQLQAARKYFTIHNDAGAINRVVRRFTALAAESGGPDLSVKASDISDVTHLAEAYFSGISVVATRDEAFIEWANRIVSETEVRVMRPSDVVLHVDELARAQEYKPAQLEKTQYTLARIASGSEQELIAFMAVDQQERKPEFLSCVRRFLGQGGRIESGILRDPKNEPIALFIAQVDEGELLVPFLRIRSKRLEATVIRQMLFYLRKMADASGTNVMRVSDACLAEITLQAMREDGFIRQGDAWVGFTVPACGTAAEVGSRLALAASVAELKLQPLCPELSAPIASDLERHLWPAKIIDSELPNFLIPIRPQWSMDLFGYPEGLMSRPDALGISREHVYYRSPRPNRETAPARLLWYASGAAKSDGVAAAIACSRLEEVIVGKPEELHSRFRHLGVWKREVVVKAAREGYVRALRFADTEMFLTPVPLRRLRDLSHRFQTKLALQSPQRIPPELFAAIYLEGRSGYERR